MACGIYFSDQGLNSDPLHWERGVLAIGPPGKSHVSFFFMIKPFLGVRYCDSFGFNSHLSGFFFFFLVVVVVFYHLHLL